MKVTQITDALQWPLDVYGVIALRDSIDHKRDFLFRRTRDQCQTLASLQVDFNYLFFPQFHRFDSRYTTLNLSFKMLSIVHNVKRLKN